MAETLASKLTYRPDRKLEVFYTGGAAKITRDGRLLCCACGDEVKVRVCLYPCRRQMSLRNEHARPSLMPPPLAGTITRRMGTPDPPRCSALAGRGSGLRGGRPHLRRGLGAHHLVGPKPRLPHARGRLAQRRVPRARPRNRRRRAHVAPAQVRGGFGSCQGAASLSSRERCDLSCVRFRGSSRAFFLHSRPHPSTHCVGLSCCHNSSRCSGCRFRT